jgi:hypothetical protein
MGTAGPHEQLGGTADTLAITNITIVYGQPRRVQIAVCLVEGIIDEKQFGRSCQ